MGKDVFFFAFVFIASQQWAGYSYLLFIFFDFRFISPGISVNYAGVSPQTYLMSIVHKFFDLICH